MFISISNRDNMTSCISPPAKIHNRGIEPFLVVQKIVYHTRLATLIACDTTNYIRLLLYLIIIPIVPITLLSYSILSQYNVVCDIWHNYDSNGYVSFASWIKRHKNVSNDWFILYLIWQEIKIENIKFTFLILLFVS